VSQPAGTTKTRTVFLNKFIYVNSIEPTDSMVGRYGTKIAALVRIMKDIFIKEPDAKVLIFSQWDDILTVRSFQ